jgi:N-acetyl-anhydromuramyl-L-alanine amidase AmpD
MIVLHTTGGTASSAINTIMNAANQVSYHFVISRPGEITQLVSLKNMAWANGTSTSGDKRDCRHSTLEIVRTRRVNANRYTVSVGFGDMPSGNPSAEQMSAAAWLIRHIVAEVRRIYGVTIPVRRANIVGHGEITPLTKANCPGRSFPFDELIQLANGVAAVGNGRQVAVPTEESRVRVMVNALNVRRGAGTNYDVNRNAGVNGQIRDRGIYTIVEVRTAGTPRAGSRWGRLKSGAGWISLDHGNTQRV